MENQSKYFAELMKNSKPECLNDIRSNIVNMLWGFCKNTTDIWDYDVYLPNFDINLQRPYGEWDKTMKNDWLISLLDRDISIPKVIVSRTYTEEGLVIYQVIDGQHRLKTIKEFVNNEYPVIFQNEEFYYGNIESYFLSKADRLVFEIYENEFLTDEAKIQLYLRTNFSGAPQSIQKRNEKSCTRFYGT